MFVIFNIKLKVLGHPTYILKVGGGGESNDMKGFLYSFPYNNLELLAISL